MRAGATKQQQQGQLPLRRAWQHPSSHHPPPTIHHGARFISLSPLPAAGTRAAAQSTPSPPPGVPLPVAGASSPPPSRAPASQLQRLRARPAGCGPRHAAQLVMFGAWCLQQPKGARLKTPADLGSARQRAPRCRSALNTSPASQSGAFLASARCSGTRPAARRVPHRFPDISPTMPAGIT